MELPDFTGSRHLVITFPAAHRRDHARQHLVSDRRLEILNRLGELGLYLVREIARRLD